MKTIIALLGLAVFIAAAQVPPLPEPPKTKPRKQMKTAAFLAATAPAATTAGAGEAKPQDVPVYYVNAPPTPAPWIFPTEGTNILLVLDSTAPKSIFIPNKQKAAFARLEWSTRINKGWQTLGYFQDHTNGFYLVELGTNEPAMFYKLSPVNPER